MKDNFPKLMINKKPQIPENLWTPNIYLHLGIWLQRINDKEKILKEATGGWGLGAVVANTLIREKKE